jgi:hypothetical protein
MNNIVKLTVLFLISCIINTKAQTVTVRASAQRIPMGEPFEIQFAIEGNATKYTPPNFTDFVVLGGPNQSSNMSFVNGAMSQSITLSYYLTPKKEGDLIIPPLMAYVGGKAIASQPFKIIGLKPDPAAAKKRQEQERAQQERAQRMMQDPFAAFFEDDPFFNPQGNGGAGRQQQKQQQQKAQPQGDVKDNIMVKLHLNKTKIYVGEPVLATFKIYTRINVANLQATDLPKMNGFWQEEISPKTPKQYNEVINGIEYTVYEIKQALLYPQRAGTLTVEPIKLQAVAQQRVKSGNSIIDQLMGGNVQNVPVNLESSTGKIQAIALPEPKPINFTGVTGNLKLSASIDKQKVKTNEPITVKVTVSGTGNLTLLDPPKLDIPADIETYDPKTNDAIVKNTAGVSGSRTFEYLMIPRIAGNFTINSSTISYFDASTKSYKTLTIPAYTIDVEKGANDASVPVIINGQQNVKANATDILFVKKELGTLSNNGAQFYRSNTFYLLLMLIIAGFVGALGYQKYKNNMASDVVGSKRKKANKLATQKLLVANKLMKESKTSAFYEEIHKALMSYLNNKYNIAFAEMSKENIQHELTNKNISAGTVTKFINVINDCELARYAPSSALPMPQMYSNAVDIINEIEA